MPIDVTLLERVGITASADDLDRLFSEAIAHWVPPYAPPDARAGLPSTTQEALWAVGVAPEELAPLGSDERRADLEAAAEHAGLAASALTVLQVAAALGVDPSRVRQRLAARTLFGLRVEGAWRLPRFQFTDDGGHVVPGFGAIAPYFGDLHPLDVATWFTTASQDLVVGLADGEEVAISPRDWLIGGGNPADLLPMTEELRGYA